MDERSMKIYEIFILTKGESTSEAFCYNRGENTVLESSNHAQVK